MKIFLCHSNKDKKIIRRLAKDLEAHGFEVWLDEYKIKVGDIIVEKIQEGINESDFLLIWMTSKALKSRWVQREWYTKYQEEIENNRVMVLPLLAEDCEMPSFLRTKRYADFRNDYQAGLKELLDVFKIQPVYKAKIEIETINPVYWSLAGCPLKIHITCESISGENKLVVFQRNSNEEENVWHFQFGHDIILVKQLIAGKIWYGTRKNGNLEYHEILAGIVPKERKFKKHPFSISLNYDDFIKYETYFLLRDNKIKHKKEKIYEKNTEVLSRQNYQDD